MSYLKEKISQIIREAENGKDIASNLHELKEKIEKILSTLCDTNDLRVYDGSNGGVLRGPVHSRRKYEIKHDGKIFICCNYYGYKEKKWYEVPYTRAIFNSGNLGVYRLIAYESPLMRKATKNINPDISGRKISCDLIGLNEGEISCIEVKVEPFSNSCDPSYALLEGFSYCISLNWILKNKYSDLINEIKLCCETFQISFSNDVLPKKVNYAIAAPLEDYFIPYWKMTGEKKNKSTISKKWFEIRKRGIETIEKAIINEYGQLFLGYMGLSSKKDDIEPMNITDCDIPMVKNCNSIIPQPFVKIFRNFY